MTSGTDPLRRVAGGHGTWNGVEMLERSWRATGRGVISVTQPPNEAL